MKTSVYYYIALLIKIQGEKGALDVNSTAQTDASKYGNSVSIINFTSEECSSMLIMDQIISVICYFCLQDDVEMLWAIKTHRHAEVYMKVILDLFTFFL